MEEITENELAIARKIINLGLAKANESLSFFMQEKLTTQETNFKIDDLNCLQELKKQSEEQLYVLTTELMGELKGSCYLIFSKDEVTELIKVALPAGIRNNPEKLSVMKEAVLLEVDNIISASVITQLSNILKFKIFGGVPKLSIMKGSEVNATINNGLLPDKMLIGFRAEFNSIKSQFSPEFFWILEPEFFEGVKRLAQNKELVQKLEQMV